MSRPVEERIRQLETEVEHLQVLPAAAVRARGRRRARRRLAATITAVAVVATTGVVVATLERPQQQTAAPAGDPPRVVACSLALPDSPEAIRVRVFKGKDAAGWEDEAADMLRKRRFTVVGDVGSKEYIPGTTTLVYGPAAIGAATVLRAEVHGRVKMWFDVDLPGDTVDLTFGRDFVRLNSTTEVNQALVTAGEPTAPPECPATR